MLLNLTTFGDNSSGIGALGVDAKAFVIQLITFILAFLVLKRYAFTPILKVLQERRETIEQGVSLGDKLKKDQIEMEAQIDKTLHETREKADDIIASAQETARETIREAEDKAKLKAEGVIKSAEERLKQETAKARKMLEKEVVALIAETTEAVIQEKVDSKKDIELIERSLKELIA